MGRVLPIEYLIRRSETDHTGILSLTGFTNMLQETAGNHAKVFEFSVEGIATNRQLLATMQDAITNRDLAPGMKINLNRNLARRV